MTRKRHIYILLLLFISVVGNSQIEMQRNENKIDSKLVWSKKDFTWEKSDANIILTCQKQNDTIYNIFLLNNTKDSIKIYTHNSKLQLLQEAKNKDGKWQPIEYFLDYGCGLDTWFTKLKANGIIKTDSKAYHGELKTEIRFKLLFENKIYYSNSVSGNISLNQFILSNNAKQESGYSGYKKFAGEKIALKVIFLEPYGNEEYLKKSREYTDEWNRKNKQ